MNHTLLLFDIDGTLLKTDAGGRAMRAAGARLFGERFSFDDVTFHGMLDPDIFADAARHNRLIDHEQHHERFREAYLAELAAALNDGAQTRPLPGIVDLIATLQRRCGEDGDVMLGLLTGNYSDAAPLKLTAVGLDPACFTITAFGDEARTRPDLAALALRKYEAMTGTPTAPERVVVIGDTPRDIECARANRCCAFGVATGHYRADELRRAGADIVVDDLSDPQPLLDLLDRC